MSDKELIESYKEVIAAYKEAAYAQKEVAQMWKEIYEESNKQLVSHSPLVTKINTTFLHKPSDYIG